MEHSRWAPQRVGDTTNSSPQGNGLAAGLEALQMDLNSSNIATQGVGDTVNSSSQKAGDKGLEHSRWAPQGLGGTTGPGHDTLYRSHTPSNDGVALPWPKERPSQSQFRRSKKSLERQNILQASEMEKISKSKWIYNNQSVDYKTGSSSVGTADLVKGVQISLQDSPIDSETVFDSVRIMSTDGVESAQREADKWFNGKQCMAKANSFLENYRKRPLRAKDMVRIGILDTGIDLGHPALQPFIETNQIQNGFCMDFVNSESSIRDNDGHGTHCAHTILQICNTARLYIGKVFENEKGDKDSAARVAKAIRWLASEKVDIVSMSFAFSTEQREIERAIREAIGHHDMLFFAAASNYTHYSCDTIGYPAQLDEVIRANSCTYEGIRSHFSPQADYKRDRAFSTIGEEILSAYSQRKGHQKVYERLSGTSMATAIMVGSAALVIEFAKMNGMHDMEEQLHSSSKMKAVMFLCMSGKSPPEPPNYTYIRPWTLFSKEYEDDKVVHNIKWAIERSI